MNYTEYKYLLFAFDPYEATGGMEDLVFKFNTFGQFMNDYDYQDFYIKQLVDTSDFSVKEFRTNIMYHVGKDDYKKIKQQREDEFIQWISEQVSR